MRTLLERHLPEHKRKFGYFCLPVLHNGNFVGMFDPKADRAMKKFHVKKLHLTSPPQSDGFKESFVSAVESSSRFNNCEKVMFDRRKDKTFLSL